MEYFNLFSNVLIVKGKTRIILADLQRCTSELLPLEFYEIINELKSISIGNLMNSYDEKSQEFINQYIKFLIENEYGFITQNNLDENFPPISYEFRDPSIVSNMVIEVEDFSILDVIKNSIENLAIKHLVIYSNRHLYKTDFMKIENIFSKSILLGIEIFSPYHDIIDSNFVQELHSETTRIYNLIFYNCKRSPFKVKDEFRFIVNFVKEDIKMTSCGKVDLKYFNTNLPKVLEAINHNSCLHKKIGIDINGNIKNCPSMPQSFGNIKDTTLEEALAHKDFKKYWNLTKDEIEVCKDCEFRYICTDCRAYTERTHKNKQGLDISKPLKCGYNPYTGEWQEWSTNPLKEKAIKYYGMQELVKK